ncbi:signal peptidase I [Vagococcus bubulae]|uniref:Signal peptidase I n=1 Tax=Vagococcus bubulae TaxID=1977868 RepID=A0A429ZK71_9ENTE|nr:signal peptidase I [Vagococcus bubulae]RST94063.1 signal peptidase I [Vagococcus bubulae]
MKKLLKDNIILILSICFILFLQLFIVSPTRVSGESMNHTLQHNDRSLVLKGNSVKRFDIIIFNTNKLTGEDKQYVKRVIGLPGETVSYKNNQLFINNEPIEEPFDIRDQSYTGDFSYVVNSHDYFVLGDNRGNSTDSRMFGGVNKEDIVGKMIYRFFPFNSIGKIN